MACHLSENVPNGQKSFAPRACMTLVVPMRRLFFLAAMPWLLFAWAGCTTTHHIVLDHNLTIKIEREVDEFLDDLYGDEETPAAPEAPKE